jgi:hypothetical protein
MSFPKERRDDVSKTEGFTVTPRRGQLIVYDKLARPLLDGDDGPAAE